MQFRIEDKTIEVNVASLAVLKEELQTRFRSGQGFALATLNLDHLAKMMSSPPFLQAYDRQDLVVADGRPIVKMSRLAGTPVDLMPGSDLIEPLCRLAADNDVRVAFVGSTQQVLDRASEVLCAKVPGLNIVLRIAPPFGFDPNSDAAARILRDLEAEGVGLCLLALGAPKQEQLAARGRGITPGTGFASIGAGLDFLGGGQRRAPSWMRRIGIEWLWRALSSPRRMIPRYLRCVAILPGQVTQALKLRRLR